METRDIGDRFPMSVGKRDADQTMTVSLVSAVSFVSTLSLLWTGAGSGGRITTGSGFGRGTRMDVVLSTISPAESTTASPSGWMLSNPTDCAGSTTPSASVTVTTTSDSPSASSIGTTSIKPVSRI